MLESYGVAWMSPCSVKTIATNSSFTTKWPRAVGIDRDPSNLREHGACAVDCTLDFCTWRRVPGRLDGTASELMVSVCLLRSPRASYETTFHSVPDHRHCLRLPSLPLLY